MSSLVRSLLLVSLAVSIGCAGAPAPAPSAPAPAPASAPAPTSAPESHAHQHDGDPRLARVAQVHSGAGPWAVAGYRMGEHAMKVLGVPRGSFDLEVVHFAPREVQYSCIADGAAAATGASLGKLNLSLSETTAENTHTMYRRKSTGQSLTLRVTDRFAARFSNVPRDELPRAGREVMELLDAEIFEVVP